MKVSSSIASSYTTETMIKVNIVTSVEDMEMNANKLLTNERNAVTKAQLMQCITIERYVLSFNY